MATNEKLLDLITTSLVKYGGMPGKEALLMKGALADAEESDEILAAKLLLLAREEVLQEMIPPPPQVTRRDMAGIINRTSALEVRSRSLSVAVDEIPLDTVSHLDSLEKQYQALAVGDVILTGDSTTVNVPVAGLDGATATVGTKRHPISLRVETSKGLLLTILDGLQPTITPTKSIVDGDVGLPTVPWLQGTGSAQIKNGLIEFEVVPDIDAGVTKDYLAGTDNYSVTVALSGNAATANVTNFAKQFDAVA